MTQTITISGRSFTVNPRYAEGHALTANEASALNQTFFENLRNNFANKAKEGGTQEDFQAYADSYQFGVRTGGGGSRDPIEVEAMNLARDAVKKGITAAGKKISDYSAKAISEAAAKLVEKNPAFRAKAAERVAEMQAVAGESIDPDLFATLDAAQATENEAAVSGTVTDEAAADETQAEPEGKRSKRAAAAE